MDYIVISDIHLGHDVYVIHGEEQQRRIDVINKNLSLFVDRQTERCAHLGKRCTLAILSDFIEFCKASFSYSEEDKAELDWTDTAVRDGLPVTERNMAWKTRGIARFHKPIFESFARLLG